MIVEVRINGAQELAAGLSKVARRLSSGSSSQLGRKIAQEGLRVVERLTPRQHNTQRYHSTRRGFPPFAKQWRIIETRVSESRYEAIIRNKAADAPGGAGERALGALEFGARPHTIAPRNKDQLSWFQPGSTRKFQFRSSPRTRGFDPELKVKDFFSRSHQSEEYVFAFIVRHPGNRSFRMVRETTDHLNRLAGLLLAQFAQQIADDFGAGFTITIS